MMKTCIRAGMVVLLSALALIGGCAKGNAVKLTYALGKTTAPCVGEVIVFKFEDKRPVTRLGTDKNGAPVETVSDVADWMGWALFDELKAAGCEPKYRTSSVTPGSTPLVTGEILEVTLNQTGTTTWAGKVSVRIVLQRDGEIIHSEKFSSEVEDAAVPGYTTPSGIMADALRGLMGEVVPAVAGRLGARD